MSNPALSTDLTWPLCLAKLPWEGKKIFPSLHRSDTPHCQFLPVVEPGDQGCNRQLVFTSQRASSGTHQDPEVPEVSGPVDVRRALAASPT